MLCRSDRGICGCIVQTSGMSLGNLELADRFPYAGWEGFTFESVVTEERLSPLVQRKRPAVPPGRRDPTAQHWSMLLFESFSAGVMAIFVGIAAVLLVVGLYVLTIWPLTLWDLASLHLEQYSGWVDPLLWMVFGAGTLAGFFCFSGMIFGYFPKTRGPARAVRLRPR